jgi:pyruvate/2-oxoglutarate dehydrogenase complex dihydrolipoamide acyltransferase (E2) component
MTTMVNLPKSGMGIEEGTVSRWLTSVGNKVEKGEPIVEVETAKALQEVLAPVTGTLVEILVTEGGAAPVNTPIAVIEEDRG